METNGGQEFLLCFSQGEVGATKKMINEHKFEGLRYKSNRVRRGSTGGRYKQQEGGRGWKVETNGGRKSQLAPTVARTNKKPPRPLSHQ